MTSSAKWNKSSSFAFGVCLSTGARLFPSEWKQYPKNLKPCGDKIDSTFPANAQSSVPAMQREIEMNN